MQNRRDKKVKNQLPCIWDKDFDCPIRNEMADRSLINKTIKPNDEQSGMIAGLVGAITQQIPIDLQLLPGFCNVCPQHRTRLNQ